MVGTVSASIHPPQPTADALSVLRVCDPAVLYDVDYEHVLGKGSFSTVFRASSRVTGEQVAVKRVLKTRLNTPRLVSNLVHEIAILEHISHKHCIRFIDAFQDTHHVYIILELITGGELFDYISSRATLTESDAALITHQLLDALRYLHSNNIIHRDIKPENVLIHVDEEPCRGTCRPYGSSVAGGGSGAGAGVAGGFATSSLHNPNGPSVPQALEPPVAQMGDPLAPCSARVYADTVPLGTSAPASLGGGTPTPSAGATAAAALCSCSGTSSADTSTAVDSAAGAAAAPGSCTCEVKQRLCIKLIDFGFARFCSSNERMLHITRNVPASRTRFSGATPVQLSPVGTVRYSAPEVLRAIVAMGGRPRCTTGADAAKSDVFAVGVVVYLMLFGVFPWVGDSSACLYQQQLQNAHKYRKGYRARQASAASRQLLDLLLKPDPATRPTARVAMEDPWLADVHAEWLKSDGAQSASPIAESGPQPLPGGDGEVEGADAGFGGGPEKQCGAAGLGPLPGLSGAASVDADVEEDGVSVGGGGGATMAVDEVVPPEAETGTADASGVEEAAQVTFSGAGAATVGAAVPATALTARAAPVSVDGDRSPTAPAPRLSGASSAPDSATAADSALCMRFLDSPSSPTPLPLHAATVVSAGGVPVQDRATCVASQVDSQLPPTNDRPCANADVGVVPCSDSIWPNVPSADPHTRGGVSPLEGYVSGKGGTAHAAHDGVSPGGCGVQSTVMSPGTLTPPGVGRLSVHGACTDGAGSASRRPGRSDTPRHSNDSDAHGSHGVSVGGVCAPGRARNSRSASADLSRSPLGVSLRSAGAASHRSRPPDLLSDESEAMLSPFQGSGVEMLVDGCSSDGGDSPTGAMGEGTTVLGGVAGVGGGDARGTDLRTVSPIGGAAESDAVHGGVGESAGSQGLEGAERGTSPVSTPPYRPLGREVRAASQTTTVRPPLTLPRATKRPRSHAGTPGSALSSATTPASALLYAGNTSCPASPRTCSLLRSSLQRAAPFHPGLKRRARTPLGRAGAPLRVGPTVIPLASVAVGAAPTADMEGTMTATPDGGGPEAALRAILSASPARNSPLAASPSGASAASPSSAPAALSRGSCTTLPTAVCDGEAASASASHLVPSVARLSPPLSPDKAAQLPLADRVPAVRMLAAPQAPGVESMKAIAAALLQSDRRCAPPPPRAQRSPMPSSQYPRMAAV